MASLRRLCIAGVGIGLLSGSARAQSFDAGSTVRLTLTDGTSIVGRLTNADTSKLTVVAADAARAIDRSRVAHLDGRSTRAIWLGQRIALVGVVAGGYAGWIANPPCHKTGPVSGYANNCGVTPHALLFPGVMIGAALGFVAGGLVGSFIPAWHETGLDSLTVSPQGTSAIDPAMCGESHSISAIAGPMPHEGGQAARLALEVHCEPVATTHLEIGSLWPGHAAHSSFSGNDGSVGFAGPVIEQRIGHLPFDPRFIGGAGLYHGFPSAARGRGWNGTAIGGNVGLSTAVRLSRSLSLRLEGRDHLFHGSIFALGAGLDYRPR